EAHHYTSRRRAGQLRHAGGGVVEAHPLALAHRREARGDRGAAHPQRGERQRHRQERQQRQPVPTGKRGGGAQQRQQRHRPRPPAAGGPASEAWKTRSAPKRLESCPVGVYSSRPRPIASEYATEEREGSIWKTSCISSG